MATPPTTYKPPQHLYPDMQLSILTDTIGTLLAECLGTDPTTQMGFYLLIFMVPEKDSHQLISFSTWQLSTCLSLDIPPHFWMTSIMLLCIITMSRPIEGAPFFCPNGYLSMSPSSSSNSFHVRGIILESELATLSRPVKIQASFFYISTSCNVTFINLAGWSMSKISEKVPT